MNRIVPSLSIFGITLLFVFLSLPIAVFSQNENAINLDAPEWNWLHASLSSDVDITGGILVDSVDNVYVGVTLRGTLIIGQTVIKNTTDKPQEAIILKYDKDRNLLWHRRLLPSGAGNYTTVTSMCFGPGNRIFILGKYKGTNFSASSQVFTALNENSGSYLATCYTNGYFSDVEFDLPEELNYLISGPSGTPILSGPGGVFGFNSGGSPKWGTYLFGSGDNPDYGPCQVYNNVLWTIGTFYDYAEFDALTLTAPNKTGYFIASLNPDNGEFLSLDLIGTSDEYNFSFYQGVTGLTVGDYGFVISGYFSKDVTFDLCNLTLTPGSSFGANSTFLLKLTPDLECEWHVVSESSNPYDIQPQHMIESDGYVVLTGSHSIGFSLGSKIIDTLSDYWMAKVDIGTGEVFWNIPLYGSVQLYQGSNDYTFFTGGQRSGVYWGSINANDPQEINITRIPGDNGISEISGLFAHSEGLYVIGRGNGMIQTSSDTLDVEEYSTFVSKTLFDGKENVWTKIFPGFYPTRFPSEGLFEKNGFIYMTLYYYVDRQIDGFPKLVNTTGFAQYAIVVLNKDGDVVNVLDLQSTAVLDMVVDDNDNIIILNSFIDTVLVGPNTYVSAGESDVYIAKYDPSGQFLFGRHLSGSLTEFRFKLGTDGSGIYFTGQSFSPTLMLDGQTLVTPQGELVNSTILGKLNDVGDLDWVRQVGTSPNSDELTRFYPRDLLISNNNEIVISGLFRSDIQLGNLSLTSPAITNHFVAKFSPEGNPLWAIPIIGPLFTSNLVGALSIDPVGDIYVNGSFRTSLTIEGTNFTNPQGINGVYFSKFKGTTGALDWVTAIQGGTSSNFSPTASAAPTSDSYFVGGYYTDVLKYDNTTLNSYLGTNAFYGLLGEDVMVKIDENNPHLLNITLWPNPATHFLQMDGLASAYPISVALHDITGKSVLQQTIPSGSSSFSMFIGDIPSGPYFVIIDTKSGKMAKKVMINR